MEIIEKIKSLKLGEIAVLPILAHNDRKLVHNYFDTHHPNIHHAGLRIDKFPSEPDRAVKKCPRCDVKYVEMTYSLGFMKNNRDEYYTGECHVCGCYVMYEPNDDDPYYAGFRHIIPNNSIAFGNYFKSYTNCSKKQMVNFEEIQHIFKNLKIYITNKPKFSPRRSKLGNFLNVDTLNIL